MRSRMTRTRLAVVGAVALVTTVAATGLAAASSPSVGPTKSAAIAKYVPSIQHVFVINIENKGFEATWGPGSKAPYLAKTLRARGVLLNTYYGTAHNSQPNYVAQISGQGPNPQMQADCQTYSAFRRSGTATPGQAVGSGCVFGRSVVSLPRQLTLTNRSWRGYMEDMATPCLHPALDAQDTTQQAKIGNQYAVRHNPFMYFQSITSSAYCKSRVVPLYKLRTDLQRVSTTRNLTYITPNLCNDGHDAPCVDGRSGGLASADAFLRQWVPRILNSPAFRKNGVLIITADEADSPQKDATACCGEGAAANSPMPGILGPGGGKIGALVISRWTAPHTFSTTPYNHYSLLASIEEIFRVRYIGYAATKGLHRFGLDVYNNGWNR